MLRPGKTQGGYLSVSLCKEGTVKAARVNRLVLLTFMGEPAEGMQSCHRNGVRQDNRLENLYWGTPKQNSADAMRHGTIVKGEDKHLSKLTEASVREARKLYIPDDPDFGAHALAARYGVGVPTMWKALVGRTWRHVAAFSCQ